MDQNRPSNSPAARHGIIPDFGPGSRWQGGGPHGLKEGTPKMITCLPSRLICLVALILLLPTGPTAAQTKISILYPVIGAKQVSLWIAYDQGLFAKQGLDVTMVESRLNRGLAGREEIRGNLFAAIGIPPTISRVADGEDLKVVAAYNNATGTTLQLIAKDTLMKWLKISSPDAAELAYEESLKRANRELDASLSAAKSYQRVLALVDSKVMKVDTENLLEHRFVRKLKESGDLDRLYATYGVR